MKKRMFFGLSLFALIFTLVAWQYAADELVDIQEESSKVEQQYVKEK